MVEILQSEAKYICVCVCEREREREREREMHNGERDCREFEREAAAKRGGVKSSYIISTM